MTSSASFGLAAAASFASGGDASGGAMFELTAGSLSASDLTVVRFRGRESLSKAYRFDVLALARPGVEVAEASLLGQPAVLSLRVSGKAPRLVHGIVASVGPDSAAARNGRPAYRFRIAPRLYRLRWRTTSRVFQGLSVPDILLRVLGDGGVTARLSLSRAHPVRAYCLQYQESDHAFVHRLLAEEGLFYYFEQPSEEGSLSLSSLGGAPTATETLVLCDSAAAYPVTPSGDLTGENDVVSAAKSLVGLGEAPAECPHLTLHSSRGLHPEESSASHFSIRAAMRPSQVLLRDYDFRRPLLDLRSEATIAESGVSASASSAALSEKTQAPAPLGAEVSSALHIYEHRGEYEEPEVSPIRARTELEQWIARGKTAEGQSGYRRLTAGHRFALDAPDLPHLSGEYVATSVSHEGTTPELSKLGDDGRTYQNTFHAVLSSVVFRPKRPKRRPRQVLESAIVVGPPGEDIHTDEHGRVKVQFHWDLEGARDDHSSCWVRVLQAWSGASFGSQVLPRVGMEVMVSFLSGDQDCPVVMGCVYNATHPPPFLLPAQKTRSGLRTRVTPGGQGGNELSFEDKQGGEQIRMHAERDLDIAVSRNHTHGVGGAQSVSVQKSRTLSVNGDLTETVAGKHVSSTSGNAILRVDGSRLVKVSGSSVTQLEGDALTLAKRDHTLRIEGEQLTMVGTTEQDAACSFDIHGPFSVGTTTDLRLTAKGSIRLSVGDSSIEITPDEIKLEAKAITLLGASSVSLEGKGPSLHLTDKALVTAKAITVKTDQAFLKLDENAALQGTLVKLNCDQVDDEDSEEEEKPEPMSFQLKVADEYEKPYADKPYALVVDGTLYEGSTDESGVVAQDLPPTSETGELTVWLGEKGKDPKLRWMLKLGDLPPIETPHGVRRRLTNLGYLRMGDGGNYRGAVAAFQRDQGMTPTGAIDDATRDKIKSAHGH